MKETTHVPVLIFFFLFRLFLYGERSSAKLYLKIIFFCISVKKWLNLIKKIYHFDHWIYFYTISTFSGTWKNVERNDCHSKVSKIFSKNNFIDIRRKKRIRRFIQMYLRLFECTIDMHALFWFSTLLSFWNVLKWC